MWRWNFQHNPDKVASISVLKVCGGGLFSGSRAANGVIMITTKSGRNPKVELGGNIVLQLYLIRSIHHFRISKNMVKLYKSLQCNGF
jgi:hypothetical protein